MLGRVLKLGLAINCFGRQPVQVCVFHLLGFQLLYLQANCSENLDLELTALDFIIIKSSQVAIELVPIAQLKAIPRARLQVGPARFLGQYHAQ